MNSLSSNKPPNSQQFVDALGRPLRDLRISVTDRCNFRCPFCMPSDIFGETYHFVPRGEVLSFEEIVRLARIFVKLGVHKIRLTGGEPLLRNRLELLVPQLVAIEGIDDVALTTNGFLLAEKAGALKDAGLRRVTVSLHSLNDEVFAKMNGQGYSTKRVLDGIQKAAEVGITPIKINVVVQRGVNDHTTVELARYFKSLGHTVRFIEYMDVGNLNGWRMEHVVPADEIVKMIDAELPLEPIERNYNSEVALRYRYKDGGGEIGIIASVTKPFCGDCSRIRLSAEGKIYTCLFATIGHDIRAPLRSGASDEEIEELLTKIWTPRTDRYSELRTAETPLESKRKKVEMFQVGG
ncbi:MAG: GTP 3',8-cyclase MoaA, partial [Bacteroidota bacterium]